MAGQLLNIGPKADGTIPDEDRSILLEIGRWLRTNGEAVYGSKVWRYAAEGPTKIQEGQFADGTRKEYTSKDIRFTVNNGFLYAAVLRYPEDGSITIESLREADASHLPLFHGIIRDIDVLGFDEKPVYSRDDKYAYPDRACLVGVSGRVPDRGGLIKTDHADAVLPTVSGHTAFE